MGSAIWIETYNRPLKETADDCCKLLSLTDQLDCLATKVGVAKLSEFYDWTEMTLAADAETKAVEAIERGEDFEPSFRNLTGQPLAERQSIGEWFEPAGALTTVRTLKDRIVRQPSVVNLPALSDDMPRYQSELMNEFNMFEQTLERALAEGQCFRFLIVP